MLVTFFYNFIDLIIESCSFLDTLNRENGGIQTFLYAFPHVYAVSEMDEIFFFLASIMAGLAGLLTFVSCVSWYRLRSIKFVFVSFAFGAFFIKALLLIFKVLGIDEKAVMIDTIILVLLYFAVIKK